MTKPLAYVPGSFLCFRSCFVRCEKQEPRRNEKMIRGGEEERRQREQPVYDDDDDEVFIETNPHKHTCE